jgi:hypothetical protein
MLINQSIIQSINAFFSQMLKLYLHEAYSDDLYFVFIEKKNYSVFVQFPLCHLNSCVPSKSDMCFANSLPATSVTLYVQSSKSRAYLLLFTSFQVI